MGKHRVRLVRVRHVFLDSEIVNGRIEMQRRRHRHRRQIRRSVKSRAHVIHRREVCRLLQVRDAATMHERHAQIVDPLVANQIMRIPHRIEHLANSDRRRGVLPDNLKAFL